MSGGDERHELEIQRFDLSNELSDLDRERLERSEPLEPNPVKREDSLEGIRERARRRLAQTLLYILAGTILLAFLAASGILVQATWLAPAAESPRLTAEIDLLLRLMELVFGPLVALVGGAFGFYFATRERVPNP